MPTILKHACVLAVRNLARSTSYYRDILGFSLEPIDAPGWSFMARDGCRIMLGECPNDVDASETGCHSYFAYITVDDVDALAGEIKVRGGRLGSEPETKPWGMREFTLRTPDGHGITFGQTI